MIKPGSCDEAGLLIGVKQFSGSYGTSLIWSRPSLWNSHM